VGIAASTLPYLGRPEEAASYADKALRLDPNMSPANLGSLKEAYYFSHRFEDTVRLIARIPPESRSRGSLLLYAASNWIGQDYLSPQALGTLLSLGIMALTLQWLYVPDRPRSPRGRGGRWRRLWRRAFPRLARALGLPAGDSPAGAGSRQAQVPATEARASRASPARDIHRLPVSAIVLLAFFVLTFTHELSPYLLVLQIGLLAVLRQVPRWLPIGMAAIAITMADVVVYTPIAFISGVLAYCAVPALELTPAPRSIQ